MAKLEIQIHENTGATKDVAPYLGTFISKGIVDLTALAEQVSALSGLPAIQIEAILRGAIDEFVKLQKEGAVRINFDGGYICMVIKGRFDSLDAAFDPKKNSIELVWYLSDEIRNSLANEVPKIVSDETSTKIRLDNVADEETPRPYQVIHGTKPFKCTGINLVTDDEGAAVYLEDERGTQHPCIVDAVVSKQEFTAHVAAAVEPGDYRLVVKSRGGDPEGVLQTTFRKVKYLAVAVGTKPEIAEAYSSGMESDPEHVYVKNGWDYVMNGANLANASVAIATTKEDGSALEVEVPADKLTATETKLTINGPWLTETMTDVSSDDVEVTFTITTPAGTTTHKTSTAIA